MARAAAKTPAQASAMAAESAASTDVTKTVPANALAPKPRSVLIINSLLVGVLWISTLSTAACYLSSEGHELSHIMQKVANFVEEHLGGGDFNDISIGSFKPTEQQIIGTWLTLFWTSIILLVVRKKYNIVYISTPIVFSLFLQYMGQFTWEEYGVIIIPFLLSVWELASD